MYENNENNENHIYGHKRRHMKDEIHDIDWQTNTFLNYMKFLPQINFMQDKVASLSFLWFNLI